MTTTKIDLTSCFLTFLQLISLCLVLVALGSLIAAQAPTAAVIIVSTAVFLGSLTFGVFVAKCIIVLLD